MTKVLVTGAGGGVGQSIIKSLQGSAYSVVAADSDLWGTGLYVASRAYTVPYASAPTYLDRLLAIASNERCALVFPGLDAELPVLASAAERFRSAGVTIVVSSPEVVDVADDKLATASFLADNGFPAPRTVLASAEAAPQLTFPLVLKPRKGGARALGVVLVRDEAEFTSALRAMKPENTVAQEFIDGDEYTCGTVNRDGQCFGSIVMRRTLRDGDTYKAFVVEDQRIHSHVRAVAERLKPFGACNFQLRLRDGIPFIFEINARCSGTTYARSLAGFNEPLLLAEWLLKGTQPAYRIREVAVFRYWKELVVEPARIENLCDAGAIDGTGSSL